MDKLLAFLKTKFDETKDFQSFTDELLKYKIYIKLDKNYTDYFLIYTFEDDIIDQENYEIFKYANGLILDKSFNIICSSFKITSDYSKLDEEKQKEVFNKVNELEIIEEGTILRLYHDKNSTLNNEKIIENENFNTKKWNICTLKTIDSKKTYIVFSNKNFTDLFFEMTANIIDFNKLDENKTYYFILQHEVNRFILPINENKLIYIGNINNKTYEELKISNVEGVNEIVRDNVENDIIESTLKISNIYKSYNDFIKDINFNTELDVKGFFLYNNGNKYEIIYEEYLNLYKIRGPNPNIYARYLELSIKDRQKLIQYYPEFEFEIFELDILVLIELLYKFYRNLYVYKKHISKNDYLTYKNCLYKIHGYYIETTKKITKKSIEFVLYNKITKNEFISMLGYNK